MNVIYQRFFFFWVNDLIAKMIIIISCCFIYTCHFKFFKLSMMNIETNKKKNTICFLDEYLCPLSAAFSNMSSPPPLSSSLSSFFDHNHIRHIVEVIPSYNIGWLIYFFCFCFNCISGT